MATTVSVIIAAYNAGDYISKALSSIESQSRAPDEVIVIDDGSTDSTATIVQAFQKRSPLNIILRRQANKGLAATRNVGVRCSRGELIAFLDADDVMYQDFLKRTVSGLDQHPNWAACFTDRDVIDAVGRLIAKDLDHAEFRGLEKTRLEEDYVELTDPRLFCKMVGGNLIPMTIVFRRGVLEKMGGFDESLRFAEDRFFLLGLIKHGNVLGYVDRSLGTWERHSGNLTAPANALKNWAYIDIILGKLLAKQHAWQLDEVEIQCIQDARRAAGASWVYCASSSCSPTTLPLAIRLMARRQIKIRCFAMTLGRYALNNLRRLRRPSHHDNAARSHGPGPE